MAQFGASPFGDIVSDVVSDPVIVEFRISMKRETLPHRGIPLWEPL
jgi:hypothetical protein